MRVDNAAASRLFALAADLAVLNMPTPESPIRVLIYDYLHSKQCHSSSQ